MQGQINRGSKLGEYIFEFSKKIDINTIVDIGTWNGMGSTKCILDGVMSSNPLKQVISIECNKMRFEEAKINLGFLPPNFKLVHGTIVSAENLYPILEKLKSETEKTWLKEDIFWIKNTSNILHILPDKIDLLIIDGGEFSAEIEFLKLWKRSRFIVLDDTNKTKSNKNYKNREFILSHPEKFEIIIDDLKNRNGFLICKVICLII